jgi:SNF2 family DNA or RNA helicase
MRVLPWFTISPERYENIFFVVRELWWIHASSIELYNTSNELKINNTGVYCGTEKITFVKNKHNMVLKHLKDLDTKYWTINASYSNNNSVYVDAYINICEVSEAIKKGIRFSGREILFFQVMSHPQEMRISNYINDRYKNNKMSNVSRLISDAFDEELPYFSKIESVNGLKTPLYKFQKASLSRMINLEEGVTFEEISRKYTCLSTRKSKVWLSRNDVLCNTEECDTTVVHFKGGFLTDNMGMGKTLTVIALCLNCPIQPCASIFRPKSTLIICPSHIISHWSKEIDKHTNLNYVAITVKDQIEKVTFKHVMSGLYDFILISFNIFCNPSFRSQMDYYSCNATIKGDAFLNDFKKQPQEEQNKQNFVPNIFDWGRIIIDEFHELANSCYPNVSTYVASLKSDKTWFVSGTPAVNISLFQHLVPYKLLGEDQFINISVNDTMVEIIKKSNVKNTNYEEVQIPPVEEIVVRIELNKSERIIYDGIRSEGREQQLKVCSYARLAKCFCASETEVNTIDEMKDAIKVFLEEKVKDLKNQLAVHERKIDQLTLLVPDIEARTRESFTLKQFLITKEKCDKYLNDTMKTIEYVKKTEQNECVICLEEMKENDNSPCVIKTCGHKICSNCLPLAMRSNDKCPICRTTYSLKDIIKVNANKNENDEMLKKYGSKLFNLMKLIDETPNVKTLIFSQWDELLKDVGKCISSQNESRRVLFCRGNIMQKKSTTEKFSFDDDYNLLLLSTLNAGSGCDLSMAKRVILLDTVDGSGEFITGIERQAIARCHRIGQTSKVEVIRYIAKDTIEEEIYDRIRTPHADAPVEESDS